MNCVNCSTAIKKRDDYIECSRCEKLLHTRCQISVSSGAIVCNVCAANGTASATAIPDNPPAWFKIVMEKLSKLETQPPVWFDSVREKLEKLDKLDSLDDLTYQVQNLSAQVGTNVETIATLQSELTTAKETIKSLTETITPLQQTVDKLREQVTDLQLDSIQAKQYSRKYNIEIAGVQEADNENITDVVNSIGNYFGTQFGVCDIVDVHRVNHMKRDKPGPRNIIVRFSNPQIKRDLLAARRRHWITTGQNVTSDVINPIYGNATLYINDQLFPQYKLLYNRCKEFKRVHNIKYLWTSNGVIKMRKTDQSYVYTIWRDSDMTRLLQ
jgi:FtsZ-binding cell division protein ZapB